MLNYRLVGKCKVCKTAKVNQELFEKIHELRFKNNMTLEGIELYLKANIKENVPNIMNLSTHFKKHIPVDLIAKYQMQVQNKEIQKTTEEKAADVIKDKADGMVREQVKIYEGLEDLYLTLKTRFNEFDIRENKTITGLNAYGYTAFVKELRSCLDNLQKMKSSEQLMKAVINAILTEYTTGTLRGVLEELEKLRVGLKSYIKDQDTVGRMIDNIRINVGGHIAESSKSAIQMAQTEFKMH